MEEVRAENCGVRQKLWMRGEPEQGCRLEELRGIVGRGGGGCIAGVGNAGEREGGDGRLGEGVADCSTSVRAVEENGSLPNPHSLGRLP